MAVAANTTETYDTNLIREDLQQIYSMLSPEDFPVTTAIGTGEAPTQVYHEWSTVDLAAADPDNAVPEGDDDRTPDAATLGVRLGNYCQIMDKVVSTSLTSDAVSAAASNIQRHSNQVAIKMRELKRDMESAITSNTAANAGSSGTARRTAGLPTFIRTNVHAEAGGTDPTLSGTTEGYPDAIANVGDAPTPVLFAEDNFNTVMQSCWDNGGKPTLVVLNSGNKRRVTSAFTGIATRYKDATDKLIMNAADIYESDFGQLQIVPSHFVTALNRTGANDNYPVYMLDPDYAHIAYLRGTAETPLAQTGQSRRAMIDNEWCVCVDNEMAHGIIRDTTNAIA